MNQGLVKGAIHNFRNLYFYFWHGECTSPASQKSSAPFTRPWYKLKEVTNKQNFTATEFICLLNETHALTDRMEEQCKYSYW